MCIYVKRLVVDRLFVHKTSLLLLLFSLWRQTKTWNIFFLFLFCIQILISFQICAVYEITFLNCCGDSFVLWHLAFLFKPRCNFSFVFVTARLRRYILLFSIPIKVPLWHVSYGAMQLFTSRGISVKELVLTQFLLIYYLSSQVLPQTFITLASVRLGYDTDNKLFLEA